MQPRTPEKEKKRPLDSESTPPTSPKKTASFHLSQDASPSKLLASQLTNTLGLDSDEEPVSPPRLATSNSLSLKRTASKIRPQKATRVQRKGGVDTRHIGETLKKAKRDFQGPFAQIYLNTLNTVTRAVDRDKALSEPFSSLVVDESDPRFTLESVQSWIKKVRAFLDAFLEDPQGLDAVRAVHEEKQRVFNQKDVIDHKLDLISSLIQLVKSKRDFSTLLPSCDALFEASIAQQIRHIHEDIEAAIQGDFDKQLDQIHQRLVKQKAQRIHPLCISFTVITLSDQTNRVMVNISSSSKNQHLITLIHQFIQRHPPFNDFLLGENASHDLKKLLDYTNQLTGLLAPKNPDRECAEKSVLSTLLKLKAEDAIIAKFIFNFALDPGAVKLIPCCDDCKKNMPGANTLLETNGIVISPTKINLPLNARIGKTIRRNLFYQKEDVEQTQTATEIDEEPATPLFPPNHK